MTILSGVLETLTAFFKFPDATLRLIRALQKTPEANHEDLVKSIESEAQKIEQTGRPDWNA